jgi:hypothetical protein
MGSGPTRIGTALAVLVHYTTAPKHSINVPVRSVSCQHYPPGCSDKTYCGVSSFTLRLWQTLGILCLNFECDFQIVKYVSIPEVQTGVENETIQGFLIVGSLMHSTGRN